MAHLLTASFVGFKKFLHSKKLDHFLIVRDPSTGEVTTSGSCDIASQYLSEKHKSERLHSGDWLPEKDIKGLPVPFSILLDNSAGIRSYASTVVQHFLEPKQRLDQVKIAYISTLIYLGMSSIEEKNEIMCFV